MSGSGRTISCLKPAGGSGVCRTGSGLTLTGTTSRASTNWQVSAIGSGSDAPTLDIGLTFGSSTPSVSLANGRFDGTDFPYNGATFQLKARAKRADQGQRELGPCVRLRPARRARLDPAP